MSAEIISNEIQEWRLYEQQVLAEIRAEITSDFLDLSRIQVITFTSRSKGWQNGKRRYRKRTTEVQLLLVDNTHAFVIKNGEIKSRRNRDYIGPDRLAEEVLIHLPEDERTPTELLKTIINYCDGSRG